MFVIINETITRFITASMIGGLFWTVFFYMPPVAFSVLLLGILCTILCMEWKNLFKLNNFWFWFIMPWYPILPFGLMIHMNTDPCYRILLYYMFVIVFAFDGTAYIFGKLLGVHKIIPTISPGKTIEGCVGGYIGAIFTFNAALSYDQIQIPVTTLLSFVFMVCAIAFVGDIFESFLKRQAHIKDSGAILPGHGGFLDRFDAVMMTAYFFFLFRTSLGFLLCK
ncbi:phosphatidate cytidylyltransferase [Candidatus Babeliales bacterium]|nr:phosphatidate cytidylyltransferase [Candidatus Babeliales bacterium]